MGQGFYEALLQRSGFPDTEDNRAAVIRQVGTMFLLESRQFINSRDPHRATIFMDSHRFAPPADIAWPQKILDDLVGWDADVAPYIQDLPETVVEILLENSDPQAKTFFGRPRHEPLSTFFAD